MQSGATRLYRRSHEEIASIPGRLIGRPDDFCARGSSHMGRGRAKAKQTKVARKLKYHAPNTDLRALERELSAGSEDVLDIEPEPPEKEPDQYDAYADDRYDGDDEDDLREDKWLPPEKQLAGRHRGNGPRVD
ncbi:MAG TPA: DUF3073 domain-containing protein [Glycomyces sp.]|nr:DUF3073 domain-containing protein [Glycomyces sp.]